MSTAVVIVLAGASVLCAVATAAWVAARRRRQWNARRLAALTAVAARIDAAVASLTEPAVVFPARGEEAPGAATRPAPLVDDGLPGRAALLDAMAEAVDHVRADGSRLSAAVVRVSGDEGTGMLAPVVHDVAGEKTFAIGPRSVALVLPGLGRADALGVLARIEARCASSGRAVELESQEDAVEFAARLLAGPLGPVPGRD